MKKSYEIRMAGESRGEILIYDFIGSGFFEDGVTAKQFAADLKALGNIAHLDIRINSPGGSVFEGTAIYNMLKQHRATKTVRIDGLAASMASVIAMVGDEVEMPANALMMIHDPMMMASGNATELRKAAELLDKLKGGAVTAYHEKSGADQEELARLMAEETWFTAEEAVALGLADKIVAPVDAHASFDLAVLGYRNPPREWPAASPAASAAHPTTRENTMKPEELRKQYPEACLAIFEQGQAEGKTKSEEALATAVAQAKEEGAAAERQRIADVRAQAIPGHEALIEQLAFDGKTTGPEAAQAIVAAEKALRAKALAEMQGEAPPAVPAAAAPEGSGQATMKRAEFNRLSPADQREVRDGGTKIID